MALTHRPRVRRLIERAAWRSLTSVGVSREPAALEPAAEPAPAREPQAPDPPEPFQPQPEDFVRDLRPGAFASEGAMVSTRLYERLSAQDVSDVEQSLGQAPELATHYAGAPPEWRPFLVLAYGMWLDVPAVSEKTGLLASQPPEDVHAMARGSLAAAGGIYEADMLVDALASVGVQMQELKSGLDIGCSSGRVVRVLAAAYPEIEWHACDPNERAIAWASENLPGIDFFVNGDAPPLPLADGSLDLAYAISIWSHFAPELGLRWFEEMRRVIRPGGFLICTTHGSSSVDFYATRSLRTPEQSQEIAEALYREGSWYAPEFGEEGDWGVVNPDWGTAFLSPEWMLTQLCPRWRVLEFAPGRNQDNQDVYVLQRV
jgi:SAM-dependent methyltransferase